VLFRSRQTSAGTGVANGAVSVEVHLPVVLVIAVRTNGKYRTRERERQNLDVRRRSGQHVGNLGQVGLEQRDDLVHVGRVIKLGLQINPSVRIVGEVLDDVAEDLAVSDDVANVVERVDRGHEQSDFFRRYP
jgi:hypothetical protein